MKIQLYRPPKKFLILLAIVLLSVGCKPSFKSKDVLATEEKENATFGLKITAYRERRDFAQVAAGAYYVFAAKKREERDWRQFMVIKNDDPIPIAKSSIVLVSERAGYVFMLEKFAVTTDAGETWSLWDFSKVQSLKDDISCRMQSVRIVEDGTGKMVIKCIQLETTLFTDDYGVAWKDYVARLK